MPTNRENIILASAADDNFAMPLAVTLYSALASLSKFLDVQLYIFDGGISAKNRKNIERVLASPDQRLSIEWITPDITLFQSLVKSKQLNAAAYVRLAIEESLPKHVDKLIYLDSDLIVYNDLGKLWNLPVENYALLAVQDYGIPYVSSPLGLENTYKLIGLRADAPYFNSGVMVINLKRWRQENVSSRVLAYLQQYKEINRFADQDGLNAILAEDWGEIDPCWNVQFGAVRSYSQWAPSPYKEKMKDNLFGLVQKPSILHFTGARKPWRSGLTSPVRHHFHTHLKNSGWFSRSGYEYWRFQWLRSCIKNIWHDFS